MNKVNIFGCEVAAVTMQETINEVEKYIKSRNPIQHVVINASKVVLMNEDPKLKEIIKQCPIINADGQSVVWASKFLGKAVPERVAGIDLMEEMIKLAAEKGYSIYFFGAKQEVIENVISVYTKQHPTLKVAGYRNGYFKEEDNDDIVEEMKKSNADILFVAFSSPKKEFWLYENIKKINIPFCMGVGGSFDVVAGVTKRAPKWMQKCGLEWFYRFLQEPRRMWKRYLTGNSKFIYLTIRERFK